MKNLISFITLLIFLHIITNYLISTEAKISSVDDPVPVLDTDGDALLVNTGYYVLHYFWPFGFGGIFEVPVPNRSCPSAFAQQRITGDGVPLKFIPIKYQTTKAILESTDLQISSHPAASNTICAITWTVDEDESTKKIFIVSGGIYGGPDEELTRRFRIEKAGSDGTYKFVYCPKVDEFSVELCSPVGIFFQDRLLGLDGDRNVTFRFRKSYSTEQLHGLELGR